MTKRKYTYVLRTCDKDGKSWGEFQWPKKGKVEAPDWNPNPICGGGLHGALMGEGDGSLLNWSDDAKWLVVKVLTSSIVDLGGKVKFPDGTVVYYGTKEGAIKLIQEKGGKAVIGGTATAGHRGTATAGDRGTATAGDIGTATAGEYGTATAGDRGTATAGYSGTATAGDSGTATAGNGGTAMAGDRGTATAGYGGTATAGYSGTATAGEYGTATAGEYGEIIIKWHDGKRYRFAVGYVGENGIEPNVAYVCDKDGNLITKKGSK